MSMLRPSDERLAIIADDLTGAADCAVQFSSEARCVELRLGHEGSADKADVLAIDTDSRLMDAKGAGDRVARTAGRLLSMGFWRFYKKIDSTLRGNVAAEIAALAGVLNPSHVIVAPAYPRMGRIVREGRLLVHDVPVHKSAAGQDPLTPVATDRVAFCMPDGLGSRVLLPDVESQVQLQAVAAKGLRLEAEGQAVLWVGSAGLAGAMAGLLPSAAPAIPETDNTSAPVIVAATSHPATRAQMAHLQKSRATAMIALDPDDLIEDRRHFLARAEQQLQTHLAGDNVEAILLSVKGGAHSGALPLEVGRSVVHALGALAAPFLDTLHPVIACGGGAARATLQAARVGRMRIIGSLLEGMPLARPVGASSGCIITKSGGFGAVDTLSKLVGILGEGRM